VTGGAGGSSKLSAYDGRLDDVSLAAGRAACCGMLRHIAQHAARTASDPVRTQL